MKKKITKKYVKINWKKKPIIHSLRYVSSNTTEACYEFLPAVFVNSTQSIGCSIWK